MRVVVSVLLISGAFHKGRRRRRRRRRTAKDAATAPNPRNRSGEGIASVGSHGRLHDFERLHFIRQPLLLPHIAQVDLILRIPVQVL
jgi:hypothetical protein